MLYNVSYALVIKFDWHAYTWFWFSNHIHINSILQTYFLCFLYVLHKSLVFYIIFCWLFCSLLSFLLWSLYCLSLFDLRPLINYHFGTVFSNISAIIISIFIWNAYTWFGLSNRINSILPTYFLCMFSLNSP